MLNLTAQKNVRKGLIQNISGSGNEQGRKVGVDVLGLKAFYNTNPTADTILVITVVVVVFLPKQNFHIFTTDRFRNINPFSASQLSTTNFSLYNTYKI